MLPARIYSISVVLATMFIFTAPVYTHAAINDTGIYTCSNANNNNLPCPAVNCSDLIPSNDPFNAIVGFPGQDGLCGEPNFNFVKLDANGNELSIDSRIHRCVRDNTTGLMWEVKTDDGGLQDKNWTYTWYNTNATDGNSGITNGGNCETSGRCDTAKFISDVNASGLCGFRDWRLPTIEELANIVDYSVAPSDNAAYPNPTIDSRYFPNTMSEWYWTSTINANSRVGAWMVNFYSGNNNSSNRGYKGRVRLVRRSSPVSSLEDQGDIVFDSGTGLIWSKCSSGQTFDGNECIGTPTTMSWQEALQAGAGLTFAGKSDWRLPNINELRSIVDYDFFNPSINEIIFPNTPMDFFWSSSPRAQDLTGIWSYDQQTNDDSWGVNFATGYYSDDVRTNRHYVRFVRTENLSRNYAVTVDKAGTGDGIVMGIGNKSDASCSFGTGEITGSCGLQCGTRCTKTYENNEIVTLSAAPNRTTAGEESSFSGWTGDADCLDGQVTINNTNINCTATFTLDRYCGDVNNDRRVNIVDALVISRQSIGLPTVGTCFSQ